MTEKQRAERILSSLADVNEDLLGLLDGVAQNINARDEDSWEADKNFIDAYRAPLKQFQVASSLITELTSLPLPPCWVSSLPQIKEHWQPAHAFS